MFGLSLSVKTDGLCLFPYQPNEHTPLTIRRPEKRRESTQTWYFTDDGRLRLKKVQNLVVQVKDADSRGVRSGAEVVLGPIPKGCHSTKVRKFRLPKGSVSKIKAFTRYMM